MNTKLNQILAEISAGELLDKITILEIKKEKINNKEKLEDINKELSSLSKTSNEILEGILFSFSYPPEGMDEKEFIDLKRDDTYTPDPSAMNALNEYSDATLIVYNSSFNEIVKVKFRDVFPVSLSTINFDASAGDIDYVTADATFKYSIYDIEVM